MSVLMDAAPPHAARPRAEIPFGRPLLGDEEQQAVQRVLSGTTLTHGPLVRRFEQEFARFTGAPHAVATSSCMAALHLACMALRIGPGDEVLVSAQTHVATAHAVELCGARCRFVDCDETGNVDVDLLDRAVTRRTVAIAVVHYPGFPADVRRIVQTARRRGLAVIEDCALAPGARVDGRHVGLFGDAGCFSFYPAKHITTGEGGMLISQRPEVAQEASRLRAFGIDRNVVQQRELPGAYDVQSLGLNYRMSEMAAAIGLEQLAKLPQFLAARRRNYAALAEGLSAVEGVRVLGGARDVSNSACYCLVLTLEGERAARRDDAMRALLRRGVGCSVYYPRPVPHMSYYREKYKSSAHATPRAAALSATSIALPVGPHVSSADVSFIIESIAEVVRELRPCQTSLAEDVSR